MRTKFSILLLLVTTILFGQQRKQIGDVLPDFRFTNVVNYPQPSFPMSAFKGKLLLVEYWSTGCSGCSNVMVRLAKLKNKYGGKVDVMILSKDTKDSVRSFLSKHRPLAALGLPIMQETAEWTSWFPYSVTPQVIWIGPGRKVLAIEGGEFSKEKYIDRLLKEGSINLPIKNDLMEAFDYTAPLFKPKINVPVFYTSSITGGIEGIGSHSGNKLVDAGRRRYYAVNSDMKRLYGIACRYLLDLPPTDIDSRLLLNLHDSSFVQKDSFDRYRKFCYELIVPKSMTTNDATVCMYMQQDLDRFFKMKSAVVKKQTLAWVLVPSDTMLAADKAVYEPSLDAEKYVNAQARSLIWVLEKSYTTSLPIVYEGPKEKRVTLVLKIHYDDMEALRKDLRKGGLDLVKKEKEVTFLELSN